MTSPILTGPAGVRAVRARAGFSTSGPYTVVEILGSDHRAFLDAQLPVDVAGISPGEGAYTAYLDHRGRVTQDLVLLNLGSSAQVVLRADLAASFVEKLERYHIREDLKVVDASSSLLVLELHGPAAPVVLSRVSGERVDPEPYRHRELTIGGRSVRFVSHPWTGDIGGHLIVKRADADAVGQAIREGGESEGLEPIDGEALEILRIEGGTVRFGVDITDKTLLLELDRPHMVSHDKGCYLGQETVARVHSRGHVNRVLVGLEIEGDGVPEMGTLLLHEDTPVGETRSAVRSPSLNRVIALAVLRRTASEPGSVVHLEADSRLVAATVQKLPLYRPPGPREESEALYRRGMEAFKGDHLEEALALFERATLMNPHHVVAFESAGVCLEKLGRLDEAETLMRSLTDMDPENTMAWTNLSRYLAQAGKIEEAEKLKGHVTFLMWKKQAGEKKAERRAQEEASARRTRLEERVELFRQVLALDAEDVVANFGLGKVYLDLGRFADAVPHFEKAILGKKHYSMAYNHLGTCLMKLGKRDDARRIFSEGIEAATIKGDFIPKRDMSRKLDEITNPSS